MSQLLLPFLLLFFPLFGLAQEEWHASWQSADPAVKALRNHYYTHFPGSSEEKALFLEMDSSEMANDLSFYWDFLEEEERDTVLQDVEGGEQAKESMASVLQQMLESGSPEAGSDEPEETPGLPSEGEDVAPGEETTGSPLADVKWEPRSGDSKLLLKKGAAKKEQKKPDRKKAQETEAKAPCLDCKKKEGNEGGAAALQEFIAENDPCADIPEEQRAPSAVSVGKTAALSAKTCIIQGLYSPIEMLEAGWAILSASGSFVASGISETSAYFSTLYEQSGKSVVEAGKRFVSQGYENISVRAIPDAIGNILDYMINATFDELDETVLEFKCYNWENKIGLACHIAMDIFLTFYGVGAASKGVRKGKDVFGNWRAAREAKKSAKREAKEVKRRAKELTKEAKKRGEKTTFSKDEVDGLVAQAVQKRSSEIIEAAAKRQSGLMQGVARANMESRIRSIFGSSVDAKKVVKHMDNIVKYPALNRFSAGKNNIALEAFKKARAKQLSIDPKDLSTLQRVAKELGAK